jgi:hypothetical protein
MGRFLCTRNLCLVAAALALGAATACESNQDGEGNGRRAKPPTEAGTDAKALAYALVPSSMQRPPEEDVQLEECPLAAGETVSCIEFNVWTTAVPIDKRRRLFLEEARNSGWDILRKETNAGDVFLIYLDRPGYRARIGLYPDDIDCTPCVPVSTSILVAGPRTADVAEDPLARDSEFAVGATGACRDLIRLARGESTTSPDFLDELHRAIDGLERLPTPTGDEARIETLLDAMRQTEDAIRNVEGAKGEDAAVAGAVALERAREAAVAARELGLVECARLF